MIRGAVFMIAAMVLLSASYSNAQVADGKGSRVDYNARSVRTILKGDSDIKEMNEIKTAGVADTADQMMRDLLRSNVEGEQRRRSGVSLFVERAIGEQAARLDVDEPQRRARVPSAAAKAIPAQYSRIAGEDQQQSSSVSSDQWSDVEKRLRRSGLSRFIARAIAEEIARSDVKGQDQ